jgi:N-acetylmuramic acid 6-phosphate (MurNAc-6-P) etherase
MKDIYIVPLNEVQIAWKQVGHYIEAAMEHAQGECNAEQLKVYLSLGTNFLMVFLEDGEIVGATVFKINPNPNERVFYLVAVGGKTTVEHFEKMYEYARSQGCTTVRYSCRDSVARLSRMKHGFDKIYNVMEKKL